jgi:CheY-like chemotaxis protein
MPEMNGFEAAKRIRQNLQSIPIIAQTAYATTEDREKAIQAGCDDLIAKPIKKDILIEMIQKYA